MLNNNIILGKLHIVTADVMYAFDLKEFEEHQKFINKLNNKLQNEDVHEFSLRSIPFPIHYAFYRNYIIFPYEVVNAKNNEVYKGISSDMIKFLYYKELYVAPYNNIFVKLFDEATNDISI